MSPSGDTPDVFAPVLARLPADVVSHFGVAPLRLATVAHEERPFSHLLRVGVWRTGNERPIAHLFVKVLKAKPIEGGLEAMRRRIIRDYETTCRTHTSMLAYDDLGVVRPVACYSDLLAIVTEQVEGPTLLDYLEREAAWFPSPPRLHQLRDTLANVGRWVSVFQTTDVEGGARTAGDLRTYIDHRLKQLVAGGGTRFTERDRARVLAHIDRLGEQLAPEELREVPIHADMSLGNVLVAGRRIVVLDFTMARYGNRLHDLTRLFVQLELLSAKPQLRTRTVRTLQQGLLEGFDPSLSTNRPLFRLLVLLHRVNNLATLTFTRASLMTSIYNARLRRRHRDWLDAEVNRGPSVAEDR